MVSPLRVALSFPFVSLALGDAAHGCIRGVPVTHREVGAVERDGVDGSAAHERGTGRRKKFCSQQQSKHSIIGPPFSQKQFPISLWYVEVLQSLVGSRGHCNSLWLAVQHSRQTDALWVCVVLDGSNFMYAIFIGKLSNIIQDGSIDS